MGNYLKNKGKDKLPLLRGNGERVIPIYAYQGRCATRWIITNGSSVCRSCEENYYINNGLIKRPTYGKKEQLTKISCSVGKFHRLHYHPMLKKYAYHRMLLCLLGKRECKNLRNGYFLAVMNSGMTKRDYAEELKA